MSAAITTGEEIKEIGATTDTTTRIEACLHIDQQWVTRASEMSRTSTRKRDQTHH